MLKNEINTSLDLIALKEEMKSFLPSGDSDEPLANEYFFPLFLISLEKESIQELPKLNYPNDFFTHVFYFLYCSLEDLTIVFNSACAITGKVLEYNKNSTKKKPMDPTKIPISTNVGENIVQLEGK